MYMCLRADCMAQICIFQILYPRPMVVIAGGHDQDQTSKGGFQEWPQVRMLCVWHSHFHYRVRMSEACTPEFLISSFIYPLVNIMSRIFCVNPYASLVRYET